MTNDKHFLYDPLKRMGLFASPNKKLALMNTITAASESDLEDVYELCKFHHYELPYKDAIRHILRNPRNISAINLLHTVEIPKDYPNNTEQEGTVKLEELTGFCCIAPCDTVHAKQNLIKVQIRCLVHNLSLGEEQLANLIYECLIQYCTQKITTIVPTKLEVSVWLAPTEANMFRTVYGYINALFHDAYSPMRLPDVGYETSAIRRMKEETARSAVRSKHTSSSTFLRRNLNDKEYWQDNQDSHVLTFPRLPAPSK